VRELKKEAEHEAMEGLSPRYIQDKISNALVSNESKGCLSPFLVLRELESGLAHHSLISSSSQKEKYKRLLTVVREEFEEIVKAEVQKAIAADEEALTKLCSNYIDNIKAYVMGEKIQDPITGDDVEPEERLMRSIEEKIDISASQKDDFRKSIMSHIASLALKGKVFDFKSNERLATALELKLFEDQKDSIKLSQLVSRVVDPETQEKIDVVKQRMIKQYGYCDICATEILNFVASIFARGEKKG
jgi:serine protein kinase